MGTLRRECSSQWARLLTGVEGLGLDCRVSRGFLVFYGLVKLCCESPLLLSLTDAHIPSLLSSSTPAQPAAGAPAGAAPSAGGAIPSAAPFGMVRKRRIVMGVP